MRDRTVAWDADFVSCAARSGRGRLAACGAGNFERYVSARTVGDGVRDVRHGRGAGTGYRTDGRRLDHGHLQLALDLLHERAVWHHFAVALLPHPGRSGLSD